MKARGVCYAFLISLWCLLLSFDSYYNNDNHYYHHYYYSSYNYYNYKHCFWFSCLCLDEYKK